MLTIFKTFFALGWMSFGGPAAHIGYFRHTFVEKLGWLSEQEYAQFVALSQFLPGSGLKPSWFCHWLSSWWSGWRLGGVSRLYSPFSPYHVAAGRAK